MIRVDFHRSLFRSLSPRPSLRFLLRDSFCRSSLKERRRIVQPSTNGDNNKVARFVDPVTALHAHSMFRVLQTWVVTIYVEREQRFCRYHWFVGTNVKLIISWLMIILNDVCRVLSDGGFPAQCSRSARRIKRR